MTAAVFDCMVFLQAATNDRCPAFACLSLVESGAIRLYVSPAILAEVRDVFSRPKIRAKFPSLTPERADLFLQKLATIAVLVNEVPDAGVMLRDPDDSPYVNLAAAAGVAYLVSRDKDVLDLMDEPAFTARFPQLSVVDPVAFLNAVRAATAP